MADISSKDLAYRTLASAIGGPVDLTTMLLRPLGYDVEKPVLGSEWIGQKMQDIGLISDARDPIKEFAAAIMVPSPGGLAAGVGKGAVLLPAITGMTKAGKIKGTLAGASKVADDAYYYHGTPMSEDIMSVASRAKHVEDIPPEVQQVGPVVLNVFRAGEINDPLKRGTFFAGDRAGAEAYSTIHNGAPVKEYLVEANNVYQTKSHASLYRELFGGSIHDGIYKAGGSKDVKTSTEAWRKVETKMASELKKRGYDGLIYTAPLAPAKTEFAVINPKTARIIPIE